MVYSQVSREVSRFQPQQCIVVVLLLVVLVLCYSSYEQSREFRARRANIILATNSSSRFVAACCCVAVAPTPLDLDSASVRCGGQTVVAWRTIATYRSSSSNCSRRPRQKHPTWISSLSERSAEKRSGLCPRPSLATVLTNFGTTTSRPTGSQARVFPA